MQLFALFAVEASTKSGDGSSTQSGLGIRRDRERGYLLGLSPALSSDIYLGLMRYQS